MKRIIATIATLSLLLAGSSLLLAGSPHSTSTVALAGYDAVAYHSQAKAVRGSGDHIAEYQGETYLFASEDNKKAFERNPSKYAPAFGGFCAYGVSVGKKFVGDPEVWRIVNGTLYLNLNRQIQSTWKQDIPGNISKAEKNWTEIKDKAPSDL
ncbi:MAG TPA: YHS domain-containing (seleno)protein [Acidobacteriota bacterium]|nr:YHS domain-containing (seleno)protein [Acidobacteriota bacterium]